MKRIGRDHIAARALRRLALVVALVIAGPVTADAEHPTQREVESVIDLLAFRDAMIEAPEATTAALAKAPARAALAAITAEMEASGSGPGGWQFLLGTAVFSVVGEGEPLMLAMFYNPWIDAAVIGEWRAGASGRMLADAEWLPGDVLRGGEIDLPPAWLREGANPTAALVSTMAASVAAFETAFAGADARAGWRAALGLESADDVATYLSPLIGLRLYEAQARLVALGQPSAEEDPLFGALRAGAQDLLATIKNEGFSPVLSMAPETEAAMAAALAQIHPATMQGLAPVAIVADADDAMLYFASSQTADFAVAARYAVKGEAVDLRQLDLIAYAAILARAAQDGPAATASPPEAVPRLPRSSGPLLGGINKAHPERAPMPQPVPAPASPSRGGPKKGGKEG